VSGARGQVSRFKEGGGWGRSNTEVPDYSLLLRGGGADRLCFSGPWHLFFRPWHLTPDTRHLFFHLTTACFLP
jgi:hypothetical protein